MLQILGGVAPAKLKQTFSQGRRKLFDIPLEQMNRPKIRVKPHHNEKCRTLPATKLSKIILPVPTSLADELSRRACAVNFVDLVSICKKVSTTKFNRLWQSIDYCL